ncbi:Clp protease ClpX [Thermosipho melanesiensis]|uniref:ATPase AAA-2 domain protein n=2 Tax=Thermosipho melanesiensis TaxID=46541 RepID=A6LJ03_THEM4|nr:ATP-dependent Clp protease ATP-binding subunit [Thermosipho melanesiensis]ABR29904.1 ATPase AAA-2 domain protein [Thermosipho melanesiensis BI429]APT73112.1 Clp protease ClpX [Thermosipho melanesiensis]OOC38511.1 Clp protease ClpX [Thermosipho melanesiensis]OOC40315.1 Clp protease ClpX [Thermosipho melanesiensis]OOC40579.1 Clp protease ClpX [Thermosipho melanesiensis]
MFDRFSEESAEVFVTAQEEAKELGHSYVGTEHLLLAILKLNDKNLRKMLEGYGLTYSKVKNEVISVVGMGMRGFIMSPQMTPRAKRVTEIAYEEAKSMGDEKIKPIHLLLGILREGEGIAVHILRKIGIDIQVLRRELLGDMSDEGTDYVELDDDLIKRTRQLEGFGVNLTAQAMKGELDPVIGREKEIERVMQVLVRRKKNNPVLIGEPGVGKSAIVEGLAQRIVAGEVPEPLKGKTIFSLDVASLVAGTKYRGEFEKRMKKLLQVLKNEKDIILFIDEIHMIVGAGSAEGAVDAANILKPALARGEVKCIGATTPDEYRMYIEKDAALERRFQKIYIQEPSAEMTIEILKGLKPKYEMHHKVKYTDEALEAAVYLSQRYISDHFLPDKAIDVIDEAGARARLKAFVIPSDLQSYKSKIENVKLQKELAVANQDYETAARLKEEENKLKMEYSSRYENWKEKVDSSIIVVDVQDVEEVVANWTGIPLKKLEEEESEKLLRLEEALHNRIVGQDEAVKAIARSIRRARSGLKDPRRPVGVFLFLGPTGVGKTELAKTLAEYLFGDEKALIRFDMSEYMEKFSVSRLIGAPPGYVGYEEGGTLTEKVRRRPFSVILFDEIEKAHPDVFNLLLQIMDDGRLTDSQGHVVDFRNTIIIMTSNIGGNQIVSSKKTLGFVNSENLNAEFKEMKSKVLEEVKKTFRPEFLNRIDEIVVFHKLTEKHIREIIDILLKDIRRRLEEKGLKLELTKNAKDFLVQEGYDPAYGARPLKRTIQRYIEDPLSEELLKGKFKENDVIVCAFERGKIVFKKKKAKKVKVKNE